MLSVGAWGYWAPFHIESPGGNLMHRLVTRSTVALLAALLAIPLVAAPASAVPIASGCKGTTTTGAGISWYPANRGAQSALQVACRFDGSTGTSMVSNSFTIHDAGVAQYHNGAARTVTGNGSSIPAGATTFTLASCAGITGYVNRPITRIPVPNPPAADTVQLPVRTFVKSISAGCLVTLNQPTSTTAGPAADIAIPGGTQFKIDNTIARSVADAVTNSTSTITSATANFTASDVGLSVSGAVTPGSTIATVVSATTATLSSATPTSVSAQVLYFGGSIVNTSTRQANDGSTTSAAIINSPAAKFKTDDVGLLIAGSCTTPAAYTIPANVYILSVSGSNATTTGGLTTAKSGCTIVIGDSTVTAPANSEMMASQLVQMDLNPAFAPGVDSCANDTLESFAFPGQWMNPGSFVGGIFNTQPAATKAVGQIVFRNAGGVSSAFVIERGPLTAGDPNGGAHYDLVFPLLPIAFALCASATSPGLGYSLQFYPTTLSQGALPAGIGKPGSAQVRSIALSATTGYTDSVALTSEDPAVAFTPSADYSRLCIYTAGGAANFQCGSG